MTIKISGLDRLNARIKKIGKFYEAYAKPNMQKLGDEMVDRIKKRTRKGLGVNAEGGAEGKFEGLATSTIESRRRKLLHPSTNAKKSNLTESGEMIESIKAKGKKGGFTIDLDGKRNKELADIHQNQGTRFKKVKRPFLFLSMKDLSKLTIELRKLLRNLIRSNKI